MVATAPKRSFVPDNLDVADFAQLEPLYRKLLDRPLETESQAEQWLADFSELSSVVDEYGARRYIDKSCHTDDPAIEKAYLHYIERIDPQVKPHHFKLQQKLLQSPAAAKLSGIRYKLLLRNWGADVELFREQNVPLETEIARLNTECDKLNGAMTVRFRDKEYTLQQLARFIEEPDRATRQQAWEAGTRRRLADRAALEDLFDRMLPLRQSIAANAGLNNYRDFIWKGYKRFDYTPQDCLTFAEAVAETCVPLMRELDDERRQELKLEKLCPWDLSVDPQNRPPLRPFEESDIARFVDGTQTIFSRLSPRLADDFQSLREHSNLDLQSRKGKQPGGYQYSLEESREPFIFMNAAGVQSDIVTLLHEGGHAFHCLFARNEPLMFLRGAPMEFCEVASMSMELLGADHYDVFYTPAGAARAKRMQLQRVVMLLPWVALIDSFQHWLYTNPGHSRDQRTAEWLRLHDRFTSRVDWSAHEDARAAFWQRQCHLFHAPFYYIEYGIAQLGALQLWLRSRHDLHGALAGYRAALTLGGTRTLPELFNAAGISFDFSRKTIGPLMNALRDELNQLPV